MKHCLLPTLLLSFLSSIPGQPIHNSETLSTVVDLGYARYQGTLVQDELTNATNTQFLGIRFAAPPTGASRFSAPSLPSDIPGIQLANMQPPICFQAANFGTSPINPFKSQIQNDTLSTESEPLQQRADQSAPEVSEDCLFLNVITPGELGQKKDLPVVVWIHGGGYTVGSASATGFSTLVYDGSDLVRASGGEVVVVLIQYRLGLFGFLSGQSVKNGGILNAGLADQRFALNWVQTNIDKFGGDPTKVTIWGQSAGAGSVLQHIVADNGKTQPALFRAAITSSTFLPPQYRFNDKIPELIYNETVSQTNCSSSTDTLNCLREADVKILQTANQAILNNGFFGTFAFVPVVDGDVITDTPASLLSQGAVNGEGLYSVTNSFEGTVFVDQGTAATVQSSQYISQLFPTLDSQNVTLLAEQYVGLGSNISQANSIMGESMFICPTYYLLNAFRNNSFKGQFAVPPATHGSELPFYFNNGKFPARADVDFGKAFSESFLSFVKYLNPTVQSEPTNISLSAWTAWNGTNEMLFNVTADGVDDVRPINTPEDLLQRCQVWETIRYSAPSVPTIGRDTHNNSATRKHAPVFIVLVLTHLYLALNTLM